MGPEDLIGAVDAHVEDRSLSRAAAAPLHDPLWLLFRQQQLGEFDGSDIGTAALVRIAGDTHLLHEFRPHGSGDEGAWNYDPLSQPLEQIAEGDRIATSHALAEDNVLDGLTLLRRLRRASGGEAVAQALLERFPMPPLDPDDGDGTETDTRKWARIFAGRSVDGAAIRIFLTEMLAAGDLDGFFAEFGVLAESRSEVGKIVQDWSAVSPGTAQSPDAWSTSRNSYVFSVLAERQDGGRERFVASDYRGGRLDWFDFDYALERSETTSAKSAKGWTRTIVPTPLAIRGMPAARWWQIEDEEVDWGWLAPAPDDLARLIVSDVALSYGGDWNLVALDLPYGSVSRIETVEVMDSFGEVSARRPISPKDPFRMFVFEGAQGINQSPFLLFPASPAGDQSEPIEDVSFHPDEGANLCWGIERTVQSRVTGRAVDRQAEVQSLEQRPAPTIVPTGATLAYKITTAIPENWIPLLPATVPDLNRNLVGAHLLNSETGHAGNPMGLILAQPFTLDREQVPREGARVTRSFKRVRWQDGCARVWSGRKQSFGHARDGSSGLRYDRLIPKSEATGSEGNFDQISLRDIARYVPEGRQDVVSLRAILAPQDAVADPVRLREDAARLGKILATQQQI